MGQLRINWPFNDNFYFQNVKILKQLEKMYFLLLYH